MSTRRWVYHVGPGKTGTTFLQKHVFAAHDRIQCVGRPNHHTPAYRRFWEAMSQSEDEELAATAIGDLVGSVPASGSSGDTVVLSDETLSSVPSWQVLARRLRDHAPPGTLLITIRNQLDAVASYYAGHGRILKHVPAPFEGRHIGFSSWLEWGLASPHRSPLRRYDFATLWRVFARELGPDRVHVLLYEELRDLPEVFAGKLSEHLGVECGPLFEQHKHIGANSRDSSRVVRYGQLRERFLPNVRFSTLVPGGKQIRAVANLVLSKGKAHQAAYTQAQRQAVEAHFAPSNRWLARELQLPLERWGYPL